MDVGIDLGTTNSVIAVKGRVQLVPAYPEGYYLETCDVTIIPTPDGDRTFPSVVWVDPHDPEHVVVGREAKQKANEGGAPIMFSKRSIGTTEPLKMHDRTYTAKQVAVYILKYLKQCAEKALGQSVRRAVVSCPVYFNSNQLQETRDAAVAAGFDMSLPEQMLMDPSAAALLYAQTDPRDPLRVMTYDLGGGTFDVTVLERRDSSLMIKAFDGDLFLGGYDFDSAFVQWILEKVATAGCGIPYADDQGDRGRRAQLLHFAESIKINLTNQHNKRIPIPVTFNMQHILVCKSPATSSITIKVQDIVIDAEGKKVQICEKINREQYAALIKPLLDKTIMCCRSALAKAELSKDELDVVLLIGGSTYAQWVQEAVRAEFGDDLLPPLEPDLCVAAGAAILAADLPLVNTTGEHEISIKECDDHESKTDGRPLQRLSIKEIEEQISARICGQEYAVKRVIPWVKRLRFGFPREGRPAAVLLFVGPNGTGKTQMAKEIARFVYGDEEHLIWIEMAQFKTKESIVALVGAPPGYVGCGQGLLTNGLRDKPECVVLFNDIERANAEVFDVLLRFADEGVVYDPAGPIRDGRKCTVVMTTNAGQRWMRDQFYANPDVRNGDQDVLAMQFFDAAREELQKAGIRPEFLSRVDERISFLPFSRETCRKIVDGLLQRELDRFLKLKGVTIDVTEDTRNILAKLAYDLSVDEGARGAQRGVNNFVVTPAIELLSESQPGDSSAPTHLITVVEGLNQIAVEVYK